MKKLLALFLLLAGPAFAQNGTSSVLQNPLNGPITATSTNCSVASACVWMKMQPNQGTIGVTITGTFSGTLLLEQSSDGGATFSTVATYASVPQTALSYPASSMTDMRIRCSAYTSGTAIATLQGSTATAEPSPNATQSITFVNVPGITDPCGNPSLLKTSTFANITTATTTGIVAVSGSTAVYICQIVVELSSTTTASTVLFEYGSGAACATSPVALTATYTNSTTNLNTVVVLGGAGSTFIRTPASNGFCAVSTVGSTPATAVTVMYVQQ